MHVATATTNRLQKRSSSKLTHNHDLMCKNDRGFPFFFQRWNKHYCVISDDKLYYAEEYEQEEEDPKKVKVAQLNIWMYGNKHEVSEHVFPTGLKINTDIWNKKSTKLRKLFDVFVWTNLEDILWFVPSLSTKTCTVQSRGFMVRWRRAGRWLSGGSMSIAQRPGDETVPSWSDKVTPTSLTTRCHFGTCPLLYVTSKCKVKEVAFL